MSDAEHETTSSAIPSEAGRVAPAENDQTKTEQSNAQMEELESAHAGGGDDAAKLDQPDQPDGAAVDGDSEAETLIQSPEKKRNIVENAPKLKPTGSTGVKDDPVEEDSVLDEADGRDRKRRRTEDDPHGHNRSQSSSRRSSPLSSASSDNESDTSIRQKTEITRLRRRNGVDKEIAAQSEERSARTQIKVRKRRPSDILPHSAKHRTRYQNNSIDSSSLLERRETRSATYPRQSSEERSPSPHPTTGNRKGHTRVASSSLALERKRRGPLPQINTQRTRSIERQSTSGDDSSSPRPRPRLHKFASGDQDTISPAKAMAIRKIRDKNGRTLLARACNNNEFANVKARLAERPEDLNVADNAGNTPLQIAALEGYTDCVRHLLENGCDVDTLNCDKDTPLIDAVENAHVEVVRLLLEYGADPRRQNAKGEEPSELVPTESEQDYQEIRRLLLEAKQRTPKRRRNDDPSDSGNREGSSRAASAASPRDSPPPLGPRSPPAVVSRRKTGRSESTPNHLLWQANTPENLIKLAEKGDVPGVASILNVINKAGPESLIAAAKAGHEEVLQLLLGMGYPEPNPKPVDSSKAGFNTPMLAAIGRGKPEIIKLLLEQNGFNPTVEFKGRKYYEISAERQGHEWRKEHKMLVDAYEKHIASKPRKHTSPRKSRESGEKARLARDSSSPMAVKQRPQTRSPALSHKSLPEQTSGGLRDGKRHQIASTDTSEKGRSDHTRNTATERSVAVASDQEQSIKKTHKSRRSQSDLQPPSDLDADTSRKRRRLVTGKEHRRGASSTVRNLESDNESMQDASLKPERVEKPVLKRSRSSLSPEQTRSDANADAAKSMAKKRRTIPESSPEAARIVPKKKLTPRHSSRESTQTIEVRTGETKILSDIDEVFKTQKRRKSSQSSQGQSVAETDQVMEDIKGETQNTPDRVQISSPEQTLPLPEPQSSLPGEPELPQTETDAPNEDEALQAAARQVEEEEQERRAAEEIARRQLEEAAAAAAAAAEKKRAEEAEARRLLEEAEAKKRAEEELIAKRKEEEERLEQARRDMEERRRRQEEQKRQEFLENERRRREALPSALCECARMLDQNDPTVRSHEWLKRFKDLYTVTTSQLDPNCGPDLMEEEWIPNFQVAGLLATKDLHLRQYTSFETRNVSLQERQALWRVANMDLSYAYYTNAFNTPVSVANKAYDENMRKFMAMEDLFWVKWSDFNDQVFRHSHLTGLSLKKQPISLQWPILPTIQQVNAPPTVSKEPLLTNGISPYASTAIQGYSRTG